MMTLYQENGLILVIHPQAELGVWLEKILAGFGHSVTITHDITQGLASFEQERHHLMIVDLALMQEPRLIDFVKNSPEIPVITVSNEVSMDEVLAGLKNGAVDHFFRQRDTVVLAHTVQRALERGRLLKQNREYQHQLEAANAELARSLETLQEDQEAGRRIHCICRATLLIILKLVKVNWAFI